ncbi:UNVERIFIED_ORG: hypothetical protein FHU00_4996 [Citrobacter freundii]
MKLKLFITLSLLLMSRSCFADWNVRGMNNTSSITRATITSDASIAIGLSGTRTPSNSWVCNVADGQPIYGTYRYLVWFIENIQVNKKTVRFDAPKRINDSVAKDGYFVVEKSEWIDGGNTLVLVGRDVAAGRLNGSCHRGATFNFSSSFTGKPVGVTLPAGNHTLTFNLRVMRIMDSGDAQHAYNLAIANRNRSAPTTLSAPIIINSYCTNNNVSSVTLNHGRFIAGSGNGNEVSATVEYECNMDTAKPKITFTGTDVTSGNQVKICDGLTSGLSVTTDRIQGYKFRTIFKSTLSGNASSSCEGAFSKSVIATIAPP